MRELEKMLFTLPQLCLVFFVEAKILHKMNAFASFQAKTEEKKPKEMKETEAVTPASKTVHNRTQLLYI